MSDFLADRRKVILLFMTEAQLTRLQTILQFIAHLKSKTDLPHTIRINIIQNQLLAIIHAVSIV